MVSRREKAMRANLRRTLIAAVAATVAFTSIGLSPAEARNRHYGRDTAVAAVVGLFGTIAATAAANSYRDNYYYGYYGGPYYYGYAPGPKYGYGGGHRGHWYTHHYH
jgi:hypothetical protein